ncbi:MAG: alpha-L-arabinofuranosidase C-terminal domain-containing protein [Lachnospiraceae bacterium]|nr:alpha-L-arabinofuranosidase C-terminal domain-containing protein [Lachnospiraceae bacterium]
MNSQIKIMAGGSAKTHPVSPDLYGIFFEDINFSCDGGINANMVNNYSFDGVYFSNEEKRAVQDFLRDWRMDGGSLTSGQEGALHPNSRYGRVSVDGRAILSNLGFNGRKEHRNECAMSIQQGQEYEFSCWLRNVDFQGTVSVRVTDGENNMLTETAALKSVSKDAWESVDAVICGTSTGYGKLELAFEGTGTLDLDCVSLMAGDYWHKGDPKWRHGKLRRDLICALADMKPSFMRFPGGCIVEGQLPGNEYNWKDTVGELYERKSNYNLWSEKIEDGGYNQSYQIGFYEYFCLCEDLGMKPLPTLSAGLNCQIRSAQRGEAVCPNIPVDSEEFGTKIIDNYLDLLEFALGAPGSGVWADLRVRMGHPEPFELDRIGVGNENYGEEYYQRFSVIEKAIHEKYPDIICVLCGGIHPFEEDAMGIPGLKTVYRFAERYPDALVDEHSYHTPQWFEEQSVRFDHYPRGGARVYFGEYAANSMLGQLSSDGESESLRPMNESNKLDTALGEAAFLTGVERNSDVVAMASYAPLFNLVDSDQWNHNLINFNPQTLCLSANYFVQKMFATHLGTQYVPFEGELPEHVYLSATEDGDNLYVKIVNTGETVHSLTVQFQENMISAGGEVLRNDNPGLRNDLQFVGEPDYAVQPEELEYSIEENTLHMEVKSYAVYVITLKKGRF